MGVGWRYGGYKWLCTIPILTSYHYKRHFDLDKLTHPHQEYTHGLTFLYKAYQIVFNLKRIHQNTLHLKGIKLAFDFESNIAKSFNLKRVNKIVLKNICGGTGSLYGNKY